MDTEKINEWLEKYKHLRGRHNQKRHGWRGASLEAADKNVDRGGEADDPATHSQVPQIQAQK